MLERLRVEELRAIRARLAAPSAAADDEERLAALRLWEEIKCLAGAAQAQLTSDLVASQRAAGAAVGRDMADADRACTGQIALARRESPRKARRLLGLARTLATQMPETFAAMQAGVLSEHRAMLIAAATTFLTDADRARLDAEIAPQLDGLGDQDVDKKARAIAYRLDPRGSVDRAAHAAADRTITVRPAPESMAYLTALLPMTTAVACYAALRRHADTTVASGDQQRPDQVEQPRSRGQVMADEFATRLTYGAIAGHDTNGTPIRRSPSSSAERPAAELSIEIAVIMTDETLLQGGDEPAELVGYGPLPAGIARHLVLSGHSKLRDKLRRLYTAPGSRQLTAMEARARLFPDSLRRFIRYRDRTCRTPWCGAPILHIDHHHPAAHGGPTTATNGQGLCAACNLIKAVQEGHAHIAEPTTALEWCA